MLNEEPAQSQDLQMMGMLLPLGIERGKDFKPDVARVASPASEAAIRMAIADPSPLVRAAVPRALPAAPTTAMVQAVAPLAR